jgi:serine/threonine protein kinase
MALTPDMKINNRYKLVSFVASGGFGEVWKAVDLRLDRTVALKTVETRYLLTEPKAFSILHDEATAGAQLLGHANVVGILDIIDHADGTGGVIVMEFIEGLTLSQWISNIVPKLKPELAYLLNARLAWEFGRAISAAHDLGLLHRDIKPHNAIIDESGRLKVTDFGLARFVDAVTRTHTVAGAKTAAYAAPEQWREEKHTFRTDIYQLGCTLYQLFTGRLPFDRTSLMALIHGVNELTPQRDAASTDRTK